MTIRNRMSKRVRQFANWLDARDWPAMIVFWVLDLSDALKN